MFKTLNGKIIFFGITICVITGLMISSYSIFQSSSYLIDSKLNEEENNVNIFAERIQSKIDELKNDIQFISSTPPIRGILRSENSKNKLDPNDGSSNVLWKSRLQTIFTEMLTAKKQYVQIRYIGVEDDGKELLRVERRGLRVFRVKDENLQSKGKEPYFTGALQTDEYKVFLSPFSLNREQGRVTYPLQMVLRAAVPIYKKLNDPFGFVIINVDYTSIFDGIDFLKKEGIAFYVIDDKDQLLASSESKSSFLINKKENLSPDEANLEVKKINDVQWKRTKRDIFHARNDQKYFLKKNVYYNDQNPKESISIVIEVDRDVLLKKVRSALIEIIALLFLMLLTSVGVSLAFSAKIVAPINKLMDLTKKIGMGGKIDFSEINVEETDEVSKLSNTLLNLSKDILQKNHQLESQKEALDSFAIVAETDLRGKITYVNSKFIEISKYSKDELIGKDHRIINSSHHPKEFFETLWRTISSGKVWRGEIKNRAKDGSYYWVDTTIFPVKDEFNQLQKYVAIRYDITDRKNYEDELVISSQEIQKAMDFKSSFLANMSHEIRTPLNGIMGFASILENEDMSELAKERIRHIKKSSENLLQIINDILDISKMEAGKVDIERVAFNLRDCIKDSLIVFDKVASDRNITVVTEIGRNVPTHIEGDPFRLRQILLNLVGNAMKFSREGGAVSLGVDLESVDGDGHVILRFKIEDNGVGIPLMSQEKIFNSFEQADVSTTREHGGTGLGLSICSRLVQLMGGKIWFESEQGVGSSFYFTMEVKKVEILKPAVPEKLNKVPKKAKYRELSILIVEDDLINKTITTEYLKKLGQTDVDTAENGLEAIEKIEQNSYDLIFMDIQMPKLDGLQATKKLRTEMNLKIPIIGLSANAYDEDKSKAESAGMDYYLTKPLKFESFKTLFEEVLIDITHTSEKAS